MKYPVVNNLECIPEWSLPVAVRKTIPNNAYPEQAFLLTCPSCFVKNLAAA
jgi:hypothetical protein